MHGTYKIFPWYAVLTLFNVKFHFLVCTARRLWPEYVRTRVRDTYLYFGSSVAITAASAAAIVRSPALFNMVNKNSWVVSLLR